MDKSVNEVCGSVRVGGKNPKNVWLREEEKTTVKRNEEERNRSI